jgi:hypothetical protein
MAHMAKLDENNIVVAVLVARDEDEDREAALSARTGDTYKRTSYNTRGGKHYQADGTESADQTKAFRKNYAGVGYSYDSSRDAFIPPQPYASWVLDETACLWDAPIALPSDSGTEDSDGNIITYGWDEDAYQADNTAGWVRTEIPA